MPLTPKDGAMLGAGMTLVAATFVFYKQKRTAPFKVLHAPITLRYVDKGS